MKDLKAIMGKDDDSSDMKKSAKLSVLKQLRQMAADMVGDDVKGGLDSMKKVTVAAPDKSSLAEGLDKAKQMLGHGDEEEGSPEEESHESPDEESHEDMDHDSDMDQLDEDMTPEEIQAKIADLQKMLAQKR